MHHAVSNSEWSLLFLQKGWKHTCLGSLWKKTCSYNGVHINKIWNPKPQFHTSNHSLQVNQLQVISIRHLYKATDHRNPWCWMVLQRWKSSVQSLSHSFCTQTQRVRDDIRETRSQTLTPTVYHLLKSQISEDYLVQGSALRRKQGFLQIINSLQFKYFLYSSTIPKQFYSRIWTFLTFSVSPPLPSTTMSSSSSTCLCLDKWFKSTAWWFIQT